MASGSFLPLGVRTRWVVALLAATIVVDVVGIVVDFWHIALIDRFLDGLDADTDALGSSDTRQAIVGGVEALLVLATGVAFIRWFHGAYRNVALLGTTELRFKPGWAIGAWFVPFLNLWRPKQIADDIWRASNPDAPEAQGLAWHQERTTPLLALWWLLWLANSIATEIASRVWFTADTLTAYRASARLDIVSLAIDIASALLAILVVHRITNRQHERAGRLGALSLAR